MPIVTLPRSDLSATKARSAKEWIKRVDSVDTTRADGYAFIGDFVSLGGTVEVAEGTYYLHYCEDVGGRGQLRGRDVTLYRVTAGEVVQVETWSLNAAAGWALKVRDEIAALMTAGPDRAGLERERAQLLARVAEIDAQLKEEE